MEDGKLEKIYKWYYGIKRVGLFGRLKLNVVSTLQIPDYKLGNEI